LVEDEAFIQGNMEAALKNSFKRIDEEILKRSRIEGWSDGATAVVVIMKDGVLYLGNVGDSEAVLGKKNTRRNLRGCFNL